MAGGLANGCCQPQTGAAAAHTQPNWQPFALPSLIRVNLLLQAGSPETGSPAAPLGGVADGHSRAAGGCCKPHTCAVLDSRTEQVALLPRVSSCTGSLGSISCQAGADLLALLQECASRGGGAAAAAAGIMAVLRWVAAACWAAC